MLLNIYLLEIYKNTEGFIDNFLDLEKIGIYVYNNNNDNFNLKKKVYPLIIKNSIQDTFSENLNNILKDKQEFLMTWKKDIKKYKNLSSNINNIINS